MPDEGTRMMKQLHEEARRVILISTLGQPLKKLISMTLRPHTRIWLKVGGADIETEKAHVTPLGIVFKKWEKKYGGITFTQKGDDGTVIREGLGRFANDRSGKEMGLIVDARWIWEDLLHTHKGLSHGNL